MNENLKDALEYYLQGRINTCVSGLMPRLTHLGMKVSNQDRTIETLKHMIDRYGKQLQNLTSPTQPKTCTLNLVALKNLATQWVGGKYPGAQS